MKRFRSLRGGGVPPQYTKPWIRRPAAIFENAVPGSRSGQSGYCAQPLKPRPLSVNLGCVFAK